MKNISINIPLRDDILKNVLKAQKYLEEKIGVSFQKKNQSVPHINLLSGKIDHRNLDRLFDDIKKINFLLLADRNKISSNGIGIFVFKNPVIYLRFLNNSFFNKIRIELRGKNYFKIIDKSTCSNLWLPKTTIAHKDTTLDNLYDTLILINNLDFNQTFIVEKLGLTEYSAKNSEKKLF